MSIVLTRRTLFLVGLLPGLAAKATRPEHSVMLDRSDELAAASSVDEWLHHPVIGDPSWDGFVREPGNPIYVGSEPLRWPVNGTLFRDPRSGKWFAFVSVYPRGYFGQPRFDVRILRETAPHVWENMGLVFSHGGPAYAGGGPGGATDASVVYDEGRYHMLFGWADPENRRGGLGYAWAERPEGPYHCDPVPVDDDEGRKPLVGRYVRSYASTLVRRRRDWLVLHMMSTPGNAGGTWGLFARTSRDARGPYSSPVPLLLPQSDRFHPPLVEFFPAYVHRGRVYAPGTSVAANRSFQVLFSAPLEEAEKPGSWRLERLGSLWHQEPVPWEASGIWGQTFAGAPDETGGLRVLFPCKTADDTGTISLARNPRGTGLRDGFVLSAPNGPAHAVLRRHYRTFVLEADIEARGGWHVGWGCRGPLGPDHHLADSRPHPAMRVERNEWRFLNGRWLLARVDAAGRSTVLREGAVPGGDVTLRHRVAVRAQEREVSLWLDGEETAREPLAAEGGRIEVVAERGAHLRVVSFRVAGDRLPYGEAWLPTEALAGAGAPQGEWEPVPGSLAQSIPALVQGRQGARAKFNFEGRRCELIAPVGPTYGMARVLVDGGGQRDVSFRRDELALAPVYSADLPSGRHALTMEVLSGNVPCGCLRVWR